MPDLGKVLANRGVEGLKILLVDDLKANLLALDALLRREDVQIFKARSGTEALELMVFHDFALALVDVQMPVMSGFELAELMRGTKKTRNVPIIFVTATAKEQSFFFRGYESGAVDFLLKPLDSQAVRSKTNVFIELYRQKRELATLEAKFRGLLDSAPDGIVIVNSEGRIEIVNRKTELLFGYERAELIGKPMEILMPERHRLHHVHHREDYANLPTSRPMGRGIKLLGSRKDGSEFAVDISLSPLETDTGRLITAAIRDISEQRQLEAAQERLLEELKITQAELRKAIQVRDDFMSIASHELKTPLTSLKLQSQLRKRQLAKGDSSIFTPDRLGRLFEADERQFDRIAHLVDDMLDSTRIQSGKLTMRLSRFDLCRLVEDLAGTEASQFGPDRERAQVQLELCPSALGDWDQYRIEQVVVNLLTNAMRYGAGKPILLRVTATASSARIMVQDSGGGIAKINHDRIFQRFERAVSTGDIVGLGLGLYIVKQIVEAHGGQIRVESELGMGATFIVDLPTSVAPTAIDKHPGLTKDGDQRPEDDPMREVLRNSHR